MQPPVDYPIRTKSATCHWCRRVIDGRVEDKDGKKFHDNCRLLWESDQNHIPNWVRKCFAVAVGIIIVVSWYYFSS